MMEVMEELKRMICTELEDIAKKGEMSPGDLEAVYKLIVAKEKLLRIDELEEKLGYSEDGRRWRYSRDGESDGGSSYGRHYVRAHYSRDGRGRYSMDEGRTMLADQIRDMIDNSDLSQNQKGALRKAMEALQE
uniref:Uncharacterized protein n=1 Tax=Myoviridae sp. cthAo37 TaxID=2827701 RepID=A0A8S5S506_9CAUD|nr:MAG TPA: hypothetical protein [Myoviridae sp. cthAo37]